MQKWFEEDRPKMDAAPNVLKEWFKPYDVYRMRREMRRDIDKRANVENEGGDAFYEALLTKEVARGWGYLYTVEQCMKESERKKDERELERQQELERLRRLAEQNHRESEDSDDHSD